MLQQQLSAIGVLSARPDLAVYGNDALGFHLVTAFEGDVDAPWVTTMCGQHLTNGGRFASELPTTSVCTDCERLLHPITCGSCGQPVTA